MQDFDKTTHFVGAINQIASSLVTIFDGSIAPRTIRLNEFGKNFIYFGRDPKNDIVLTSHLVSSEHGRFVYKNGTWTMEDKAAYKDTSSTNGLIYNNASIISRTIRDAEDKEKWLIDEPAAAVVRKIYELCLAGRGPSQIARQLESERVLVPSAYYESVGRKHSQKVPLNPYNWDQATVVGILENRQYTGCAVNFKSTTVSYKVHKVIHNPVDQQQIIPNMQEPIVSEEIWLRVQELRENRRRNTATGRTSLFSGLVFCPDCGAKLHFCAAKSLKPNQEFFRCANYKDGRGTCKIHYIRNVALEKIVLEAISDMADFVRCHESIFMYMIAKKNKAMQKAEFEQLKKTVSNSKVRLGELDKLMAKLYEDNVLGRVTDDFFQMMMKNYEREQKELTRAVANGEQVLQSSEQKSADTRLLIRTFREMTDIKELTPIIVNKLIERIEVHNNDKTSGHCYVKVDVCFTGVGMISIPSEEELLAMMEDIRKNPEEYCLAA